jgi:Bacterial Ig-like domain (group 3)/FG-GAP-like repeat
MRYFRLLPSSFSCVAILVIGVLLLAEAKPAIQGDRQNLLLGSRPIEAEVESIPAATAPAVTFAKAVNYDSGGYWAFSIAVADVNEDGKPDLVVANCGTSGSNDCSDGMVGVLLGNGDGTFQGAISYLSGGWDANSIAVADVNGDGHKDLIVSNGCSSICSTYDGVVSILLGSGNGSFGTPVTYSSGGLEARSVAVGDLNGDGHPDVVVGDGCLKGRGICDKGAVAVLLGNGDGTFQPPVSYDSGGYSAQSVAIADINGDGRPDLVVANLCQDYNTCGSGGLSVFLGNGDGTFGAPARYVSGGVSAESVAIADVNGDGHPDVVVANYCQSKNCSTGSISVLLGNGDGTFSSTVPYSSGGFWALSAAVQDVNGDGFADVIVAGCRGTQLTCNTTSLGSVSVLLGNGDGTFQPAVKYSSGGYEPTSVGVGDVNGDGRTDVIVANSYQSSSNHDGGLGVLFNETSFKTRIAVTSSLNPSLVNQEIMLTAVTTSSRTVPDGEVVTFYNGSTRIGSGTTTNGVASLVTSFPKSGKYMIKATYSGDLYHKASSGTLAQVVNRYSSTTVLTSNPNPSASGQAVTLTATVTSGAPGGATGTVTFKDGTALLGTKTLSAGIATLTTTKLPVGTLTITANYSGDAQSATSSVTLTQVVSP